MWLSNFFSTIYFVSFFFLQDVFSTFVGNQWTVSASFLLSNLLYSIDACPFLAFYFFMSLFLYLLLILCVHMLVCTSGDQRSRRSFHRALQELRSSELATSSFAY